MLSKLAGSNQHNSYPIPNSPIENLCALETVLAPIIRTLTRCKIVQASYAKMP